MDTSTLARSPCRRDSGHPVFHDQGTPDGLHGLLYLTVVNTHRLWFFDTLTSEF